MAAVLADFQCRPKPEQHNVIQCTCESRTAIAATVSVMGVFFVQPLLVVQVEGVDSQPLQQHRAHLPAM